MEQIQRGVVLIGLQYVEMLIEECKMKNQHLLVIYVQEEQHPLQLLVIEYGLGRVRTDHVLELVVLVLREHVRQLMVIM
jgi:hypothetical protein